MAAIDGGPRLATFVASNLFGSEIHSLYGWHNRDHTTLEGGINRADMSKTAIFYKESIAKQFWLPKTKLQLSAKLHTVRKSSSCWGSVVSKVQTINALTCEEWSTTWTVIQTWEALKTVASCANVLRGSSSVPTLLMSTGLKDKFLSHCSQKSPGDHKQTIGDPIC